MATKRMTMRKTREILRQKWELKLSHRQVAASLGCSPGAVGAAVKHAALAGLDWETVCRLGDEDLDARLYAPSEPPTQERPLPDFQHLHRERRRPGVTLELLHLEYLEEHPGGYRYTQFCEKYRRWLKKQGRSMRQVHFAGEKLFVDYSGKKPHYFDPKTGEKVECELFVAVLGASNFTYAEATWTQKIRDWIASHIRAFGYIGGVTKLVVPDQLKSGVTRPDRYEPGVQRTYAELAEHYETAILPARARKPKDKAKVEAGVQVVQRWILARLRDERFFSLAALNQRIAELLEELNDRPMKLYGASRRELFEQLDKPALLPLPGRPFTFGEWQRATVNIDYHVAVDHHFYSVPHQYVGEEVDIRVSASTVEVFLRRMRLSAHSRSRERGRHTTIPEHMPEAHRGHLEWSPSRLCAWAAKVGPRTAELVENILESRPHPEHGYRSCLGIMRLSKKYGQERLEAACERGLAAGARSYRHIDSILKNGLDQVPLDEANNHQPLPAHENVRGSDYYTES